MHVERDDDGLILAARVLMKQAGLIQLLTAKRKNAMVITWKT